MVSICTRYGHNIVYTHVVYICWTIETYIKIYICVSLHNSPASPAAVASCQVGFALGCSTSCSKRQRSIHVLKSRARVETRGQSQNPTIIAYWSISDHINCQNIADIDIHISVHICSYYLNIYLVTVWWMRVNIDSQLSSIFNYVLKRIQTPYSWFWDFWAHNLKVSTTRWSGCRVQVWVQVWAPACHLAISHKGNSRR